MSDAAGTVLWWGRFDPDYSRNRILRQADAAFGWRGADFHPWLSALGGVEAVGRRGPRAVLGPVLFLASSDSSFVTGHLLLVDGGNTAQ